MFIEAGRDDCHCLLVQRTWPYFDFSQTDYSIQPAACITVFP